MALTPVYFFLHWGQGLGHGKALLAPKVRITELILVPQMQGSHGKVDWRCSAVRLHSETVRLRIAKMQGTLKRMPEAPCPWNATWSIWCNCDCSFSTLRGLESGDGE